MGNKPCSCISSSSPKQSRSREGPKRGNKKLISGNGPDIEPDELPSVSVLPHISEREQLEDWDQPPSDHPETETIFLHKSRNKVLGVRRGQHSSLPPNNGVLKRFSSCSTIYIDDSTVSQPNIKATIKCVALGVYHLIERWDSDKKTMEIFDEKRHPLTRDRVPSDYDRREPDHRHIYRFIRTLFTAAQLTAECAIVTLVYLERLLTYAEITLCPANWKRIVLGAILLASKVWDDQAVWNVDYCQILKDMTVEDMNELERQFLELLQFNTNVPSGVYAKYYFELRQLADENNLVFPVDVLSKERALKLEATSRVCADKFRNAVKSSVRRTASVGDLESQHNSSIIIS